MNKQKAIYFFQYLPPWKIDVFNEMARIYDLTIVFWNVDCVGFTYNHQELLKKLNPEIDVKFLRNGINAGAHSLRLGINRIIHRISPQVIFSHEFAPITLQCVLTKALSVNRFRLVITTSDNVFMADSVHGIKAMARYFILRASDGIILYSSKVAAWYQQKFPFVKTAICPNIQNPKSLLANYELCYTIGQNYRNEYDLNGYRIMLYVGRLSHEKGIDLLLNAFAKVSHNGWKLVVVGKGEEEKNLQAQAAQLGIVDDVVFAKFCSSEHLYAWYTLANFFVLPSRYEPFGAVVNEALVFGCPVLASKNIGAIDFINSSNGVIFDPNDDAQFVQALTDGLQKYGKCMHPRPNLMTCSFEDSVAAYSNIIK